MHFHTHTHTISQYISHLTKHFLVFEKLRDFVALLRGPVIEEEEYKMMYAVEKERVWKTEGGQVSRRVSRIKEER